MKKIFPNRPAQEESEVEEICVQNLISCSVAEEETNEIDEDENSSKPDIKPAHRPDETVKLINTQKMVLK